MSEKEKPAVPKVSKEDVDRLIKGQMSEEQVETAVPLDLPDDVLEGTRGPESVVPTSTPSDIDARTKFDPDAPTSSAGLQWTVQTANLKVEVEWSDKVAFLKALTTDTRLLLDVDNTALNITIRVGNATQFEQDIAFAALRRDEDQKLVTGPAEYATKAQQYLVALQVHKVGEVLCDKRVVITPDMDVDNAIEKLRTETRAYVGLVNAPRWGLLLHALRVFEVKQRLCLERLDDKSFWKPADSA